MDRLACVDVPALPLQLLLKEHPDWKDHPVAVVAEDKPQALLLWVNEKARRCRVLPGQRYAAALSLTGDLRAAPVPRETIEAGLALLTGRLRRFTPEVEPARESPGVFWLNAKGLELLFPSLEIWSQSIHRELLDSGFQSAVVVGFTRFGTYAVARSSRGTIVFPEPAQEKEAAGSVLLERLDIDPRVRDALLKLGVRTVRDLLRLPAAGLGERFGEEAFRLHRWATGHLWTPLRPEAPFEPLARHVEFLPPDSNTERLLFLMKPLLDELLAELARRGEALAELDLQMVLDHAGDRGEAVRPAAPTLEASQILGLVRLRLESVRLPAGIAELTLTARGVKASREQLLLFAQSPPRDLKAASRAFARLRAQFGDGVVVRARLTEGHLPRASFVWEPLEKAALPAPRPIRTRTLVRRIFEKPIPLPPRARNEPDGWLLRGLEAGPVRAFVGPYIISGGWWREAGTHREYYFAKMQRGELLWVFYDRRHRRWFLEGRVE
jgi:protein ImuB